MKHSSTLIITLTATVGLFVGACGSESKSGSGGDFCTLARAYDADQEATNDIFNGTLDAAGIKKAYEDVASKIGAMVSAAPAEIKKDAQVLQTGLGTFNDVLKSVDYDIAKLAADPEAAAKLAVFDSPEFNAASDNLDKYLSDTCGIDTSS